LKCGEQEYFFGLDQKNAFFGSREDMESGNYFKLKKQKWEL